MRPLFLILCCLTSSILEAGPGGGGGGSVRDVSYFEDRPIYSQPGSDSKHQIKLIPNNYYLSILELKNIFRVNNIRTIDGAIITVEMLPDYYPINHIDSIEMENGQVLLVDEIIDIIASRSMAVLI